MARVKGAMMTRKRRNKVLKAAKGYWGAKSKQHKWHIQDNRHNAYAIAWVVFICICKYVVVLSERDNLLTLFL